ncbi:MAG: type II/IV secretion system ATPase subunit [Candidatus Thermoplasmatota archaeon]|jgi:flagellar protein FlaI|nr:type II/IV secretion system ATPase subunit [Candidatus Thermoplasmatota archaeon]MCL5785566.1 type II/IV secretion system ATPase subunit [Candidatus Thermoplasmatota archaeon]
MNESSEPDDLSFDEIVQGLVYSRVFMSKEDRSVKYHLIEPYIDDELSDIIEEVKQRVIDRASFDRLATDDREKDFEKVYSGIISELALDFTPAENTVMKYYVRRDVVELGRIQGLMYDQSIEDVSCDGQNVPVFVFHRAHGFIPSNVIFKDEGELNTYVKKIVQDSGKHISISVPIIDATLPDGSRLQASYGRYITSNGPAFTIRKFRSNPLSPVSLIMTGSVSARIMSYLWILTEYGANMMVAGGTGSGKTTLLNAILLFIPPQMKVVSIEDTREINIPHENWIATVTRSGFGALNKSTGKRAGEIDMFDLLAASLRQRPNYIIIGEVRGKEAFTVFQAMSAGRYGFGTFHAEDPKTLIHRLESPPINIPRTLITALDVIIMQSQLSYNNKMVRRATSISEITGLDQATNDIIVNNIFKWTPANDVFTFSGFSYVMNRIAERIGKTESDLEHEAENRERILNKMIEKKFYTYRDVTRMITMFYKDKEELLKELELNLET